MSKKHSLKTFKTKQAVKLYTKLVQVTSDLCKLGNVAEVCCRAMNDPKLSPEEKTLLAELVATLEERVQDLGYELVIAQEQDSGEWHYFMMLESSPGEYDFVSAPDEEVQG